MKILLTAINAKYIHSNLAIYSLKANLKQYKDNVKLKEYTINHRKEEVVQSIYLEQPDVLMLSCYIWNIEFIEAVIEDIKKVLPDLPVWLGGPEVSYLSEQYLENHPYVKGIMRGEGEETFREVVEYYVNKDKKDKTQTFRYNGEEYLLVSRYSEYLNQAVYQCSLKDDFLWEEKTGYLALIIYVLFSGILAFTYPRTVKKIVTIPIYRLIDAFQGLANDKFEEQITYKASDEFNYLYDEFNRMVVRLKKLIDENYKSKLLVQEAELKQMQAQINPHFMYNTYFILHRMILDEDIEEAARLSEYLGIYMEYITHNSDSEVLLTRELEHTKSYLEIQQIRFGGRMRLHIEEVPEEYQKLRVPRLILQPVVENYLKYGYEISDAQGELFLRFIKEENGISILIGGGCVAITSETVRDLQERLNEQESQTKITGLINIHRRLKIYFGNDSGVYLHRDEEERLITKLVLQDKAGVGNV